MNEGRATAEPLRREGRTHDEHWSRQATGRRFAFISDWEAVVDAAIVLVVGRGVIAVGSVMSNSGLVVGWTLGCYGEVEGRRTEADGWRPGLVGPRGVAPPLGAALRFVDTRRLGEATAHESSCIDARIARSTPLALDMCVGS